MKIPIFFLNKITNFDHGISAIEMYLLTSVVTYEPQFQVVRKSLYEQQMVR